MTRPVTILCAFIAAFAAPETVAGADQKRLDLLPGILGADDRTRIDSANPPWNAIGRVNRRFGGFCTGTLVGPDRVLTAAHCLYNARAGRWPPAGSLHFVAGYRRNEFVADAAVAASEHPEIVFDRRGRTQSTEKDWAFLTLAKALATPGSAEPGEAAIRPFRLYSGRFADLLGKPLILAAYHQDAAHILSVETDCRIVANFNAGAVFTHTCDSTHGASGGPIFVEVDGEMQIVGITVGIGMRGGKRVGVGVRPGF